VTRLVNQREADLFEELVLGLTFLLEWTLINRDAVRQCVAVAPVPLGEGRALVEADISRWKRVIGDGLRSQTDGRQATEVAIAAKALNHMLELGRPEYIRIA